MNTRKDILEEFYGQYDEDGRTARSRHGQLEYCITMNYIHRYATGGSKILEVGAGTGRYSIALAEEGMDVTAVELLESNLAVLRENSKGMGRAGGQPDGAQQGPDRIPADLRDGD